MKVSIYMAFSANGLISNTRNVPDWLSEEYAEGMMAISQKTKAVIMGKTTYNILAPDYLPLKDEGTTVVLTNDVNASPPNSTVVFTNKTPLEIVSMLEKNGHEEAIIIGGAIVVSDFMKANLVNEIDFVIEPVLFARGLPLLKGIDFEMKLNLIDMTKLNDSTICLHYKTQN